MALPPSSAATLIVCLCTSREHTGTQRPTDLHLSMRVRISYFLALLSCRRAVALSLEKLLQLKAAR